MAGCRLRHENEKRRNFLTRHLEEIGVASRYQRFDAVDGRAVAHEYPTILDPGNLGLWLSHEKLLQANSAQDQHLHIIEDDIFAKNAGRMRSSSPERSGKHLR